VKKISFLVIRSGTLPQEVLVPGKPDLIGKTSPANYLCLSTMKKNGSENGKNRAH
jgi:hypothetical protein